MDKSTNTNNDYGYRFEGILVKILPLELKGKTGSFKVQDFVVAERIETITSGAPSSHRSGGGLEGSTWKSYSQEVAPTQTEKWVNPVKFTIKGHDADNIMMFREGQRIVVLFDIIGREYNGKFFTELAPYDMAVIDGNGGTPHYPDAPQAQRQPTPPLPPQPHPQQAQPESLKMAGYEDLPF